jgi:hypothetical protein
MTLFDMSLSPLISRLRTSYSISSPKLLQALDNSQRFASLTENASVLTLPSHIMSSWWKRWKVGVPGDVRALSVNLEGSAACLYARFGIPPTETEYDEMSCLRAGKSESFQRLDIILKRHLVLRVGKLPVASIRNIEDGLFTAYDKWMLTQPQNDFNDTVYDLSEEDESAPQLHLGVLVGPDVPYLAFLEVKELEEYSYRYVASRARRAACPS